VAVTVRRREGSAGGLPSPVAAGEAAALGASDVLARLASGTGGLPEDEAARRLRVASLAPGDSLDAGPGPQAGARA
jgi:hypothetical protein